MQVGQYYLVGENDVEASTKLGLASIEYNGYPSGITLPTEDYLAWIKQQIRKDNAVTATVYMNYYWFYGITKPTAGEFDYDVRMQFLCLYVFSHGFFFVRTHARARWRKVLTSPRTHLHHTTRSWRRVSCDKMALCLYDSISYRFCRWSQTTTTICTTTTTS